MSSDGFDALAALFEKHGIDKTRLGLIRLTNRLKAPEGDDSVWVELVNTNDVPVEWGVVAFDRGTSNVELLMLKPFEPWEHLAFATRLAKNVLVYMVEVKP